MYHIKKKIRMTSRSRNGRVKNYVKYNELSYAFIPSKYLSSTGRIVAAIMFSPYRKVTLETITIQMRVDQLIVTFSPATRLFFNLTKNISKYE